MNNDKIVGHFFLIIAAIIYGMNHTIAKDAMPTYISPLAFVLFRNLGATVFFWSISSFIPKQKIEKKDYVKIIFAAIFGIALNQMLFFVGLNLTTPIYSGVIMTTSPIIVIILSYFFLKEKVFARQVIGVFIGVVGVLTLFVFAKPSVVFQSLNPTLGNFYIFLNAVSYGAYLIIAKPLLQKYNAIHILKWIVAIGLIIQIPFGYNDFFKVEWQQLPPKAVFAMFEVVVLVSCVVYSLNLMALKRIRPTTVSAYIFAQPFIATVFALLVGKDDLDVYKLVGGLLILTAVFFVSFPKGLKN